MNAKILSGKVVTSCTLALATILCSHAYAASTSYGEGGVSQPIKGMSGPFFVQATGNDTGFSSSGLTPQLGASTAQEAIRRGESVSITSDFGQIQLCAPVSIDGGNLLSVTVVYTLFADDTPVGSESVVESDLGSFEQSQILPTELEAEGELSMCQLRSEDFSSPKPVDGSNILESGDETGGLVRTFLLEGTLDQVVNAAAFLGSAIATGVSLDYAEVGASLAITEVNYSLIAELIATLPEMVIVDPSNPEYIKVNIEALSAAILLSNQIINDSSDATLFDLAENSYFLEINDNLRYFRSQF